MGVALGNLNDFKNAMSAFNRAVLLDK